MRLRTALAAAVAACAVAAGALASASPVGSAPVDHAIPRVPVRWLAAGDSFSAGFGIDDIDLVSRPCLTAPNAWPAVAKDQMTAAGWSISAVDFDFVACSGATADDLLGNELGRATGKYELVTLSVGGNDAGFVAALGVCVGLSLPTAASAGRFSWLTTRVSGCPPDALVREAITAVGGFYQGMLAEIANRVVAPGGNVVVVGYPAIFEQYDKWNVGAKVTGLCNGVNPGGVDRIRGWAGALNATIGSAVNRADAQRPNGVAFSFVNVQDGAGNNPGHSSQPVTERATLFEASGSADRHNLCGSDSWMNGGPFTASLFHPNATGHASMASTVATTLSNLDWSRLGATPGPPKTGDTIAPKPPPSSPTTTPPNPTTTGSTVPSERVITVDNRVTNGGSMREDDLPAYLSTVTQNFCKRDGCALGGTDMGSGARITAICQANGARTTNGQDNSSVDDGNPELYTSTRWYGIRWGDGRFGYLSEVWITGADRGGLGLRGC